MEILVTGATSIIGVPLIKELLTEGHTVNACLLYTSDAADEL